jgi:hypothetical protein
VTQKPELGVKTQNRQLQKRLWVFTQYWFLRTYIKAIQTATVGAVPMPLQCRWRSHGSANAI